MTDKTQAELREELLQETNAPLTKQQAEEILKIGDKKENGMIYLPLEKWKSNPILKDVRVSYSRARKYAYSGEFEVLSIEELERDIAADISQQDINAHYRKPLPPEVVSLIKAGRPYEGAPGQIWVPIGDIFNNPVFNGVTLDHYVGYVGQKYNFEIFDKGLLGAGSPQNQPSKFSPAVVGNAEDPVAVGEKTFTSEQAGALLAAADSQEGQVIVSADKIKEILNTATIKKLDQYKGFLSRKENAETRQKLYVFDGDLLQEQQTEKTVAGKKETAGKVEKPIEKAI